jgi:hypothetical protein
MRSRLPAKSQGRSRPLGDAHGRRCAEVARHADGSRPTSVSRSRPNKKRCASRLRMRPSDPAVLQYTKEIGTERGFVVV